MRAPIMALDIHLRRATGIEGLLSPDLTKETQPLFELRHHAMASHGPTLDA